jgi:F-type H+-transporting ATPase subunit b
MLINEAGWVAFGFIIFCIIAWRYGAKPFVDVLEARANEVKEKLSEAENLRNEAKEVLDNFKVLQKEAENEAENIILRAKEMLNSFKLQLRKTLKNLFLVRKNKLNKKLKLRKNKHS